jgi:hypothetical protein
VTRYLLHSFFVKAPRLSKPTNEKLHSDPSEIMNLAHEKLRHDHDTVPPNGVAKLKHLLFLLQWCLFLILLLALRDGSILVLLVLGNQIVHVGLSLSELHLVHTFTSVPMQESLSSEHGSELVTDTLEELLNGGRVTNEGGRHLKTTRRDGAEGSLDVVGDPLDEVGGVLVLDVAHLVLDFLHGDLTTAVRELAK